MGGVEEEEGEGGREKVRERGRLTPSQILRFKILGFRCAHVGLHNDGLGHWLFHCLRKISSPLPPPPPPPLISLKKTELGSYFTPMNARTPGFVLLW